MDYFIAINGTQMGPYPIAELLTRGVQRDTLVWKAGMAQWQRADSLTELQGMFAGPAAVPPPMAPNVYPSANPNAWPAQPGVPGGSAYVRDKRILAGVMGILFGGLGVHKFILGYTGTGLIMLLTTVLTFGLAGIVMHPIGLIEGIIYLSKSDAEFEQTYMIGRRSWF